jgi:hypothetical protein
MAAIMMAGTAGGTGPAWARGRAAAAPLPAHVMLSGVAATSARDVWVVGEAGGPTPLIGHWNGSSWRLVPEPYSSQYGGLSAVTALSAGNAWAVGAGVSPWIVHWNGRSWQASPISGPALTGGLESVTAVSATDIWAVGYTQTTTGLAAATTGLTWRFQL